MSLYQFCKDKILILGFLIVCVVSANLLLDHIIQNTKICSDTSGFITNDGKKLHRIAVDQAEKIKSAGWKTWELAPQEQPICGLVSVFYAVFSPKKTIYIIFASLLNVACLLFLWYFLSLNNKTFLQNPGFLAFLFYPSILEWTISIHRDGVFILANYIFIYAFFLIRQTDGIKNLLKAQFCIFVSFFLVENTRSYWTLWLYAWTLAIFLWKAVDIFKSAKGVEQKVVALLVIICFLFSLHINFRGGSNVVASKSVSPPAEIQKQPENLFPRKSDASVDTSYSHGFIENKLGKILKALYTSRNDIIRDKGFSLDPEAIESPSGFDLIREMCRSFQRGLFSPLPDLWFQAGSSGFYSLGKRMFLIISPLSWFCLAGVVFGIFTKTWNKDLLLVFSYCLFSIWLFSFVVPNVGTMMRLRYGFYGLLLAAGASYWLHLFSKQANHAKADS